MKERESKESKEEKNTAQGGEDSSLADRARRAFKFGSNLSGEEGSDTEKDIGKDTVSDAVKDAESEEGASMKIRVEREVIAEEDSSGKESELSDDEVLESLRTAEEKAERIIEAHREEAQENYDKYLRAVADLENFKKRAARERADLIKYAGEAMARDFIEVVDDLERALGHARSSEAENAEQAGGGQELREGIALILKRAQDVLERHSVVGEDAIRTAFDPTKHEALATIPSAEHQPGTIIEQLKKAYFFKDKLLRAAQVVVAAEMPGTSDSGSDGE